MSNIFLKFDLIKFLIKTPESFKKTLIPTWKGVNFDFESRNVTALRLRSVGSKDRDKKMLLKDKENWDDNDHSAYEDALDKAEHDIDIEFLEKHILKAK